MPRLAIIGNGEKAALHTAAARQIPEIKLVAEADADVIDVCASNGQAGAIATSATQAGKQVLFEYLPEDVPAGASVGLLRPDRWQPLAKQLKATLDAGKLGALRYAHAASIWHAPEEQHKNGDPGSFLIEHTTGTLDLIRWLFDAPVAKVFARDCSLEGPDSPSHYVSVVVFFADASQAICEVGLTSSFAANTGLQRLALTGMRGSAYFNERDADVVLGGSGVRSLVDDPVEGLTAAFAHWVEAGGTETDNDIEDGQRTLQLVLAAAESVRTGQPVDVEA